MKTTCQMMTIILWVFLLSGCVLTQFTNSNESSDGDAQTVIDNGNMSGSQDSDSIGNKSGSDNRDVLASLTQTQKLTLLALLDSYDSNQEAIEAWKASQASVARLVELEKDLKFLILQLDSLSHQAQDAQIPSDNSINATAAETVSTGALSKESVSNQTQTATVSSEVENNKSSEDRQFSSAMMAGFTVQLTAVNSMKHLRTYWQRVKTSNPVMFSEASPFYESILDSKGNNMFRLKVGKFDTKPDAMRFCREFVASGGSCFVTDNVNGVLLQ